MRNRRFTLPVVISLVVFLSGSSPAQTEQTAGAADRPAVRQFEPPPVRPLPEPVLVPPPDNIFPGQQNPSISQQSQSLLGRTTEALPPPPASTIIRAIFGFVALMVLAFIAGTRRVHNFERQWHVAHLMTTGLPFVLLGLFAAIRGVGILTPGVLREVAPLLPLGLGWIGFVVGLRFDGRSIESLPSGTSASTFVMTALPAGLMTAGLCITLSLLQSRPIADDGIRDALLLATAGIMAARSAPEFLRSLLPSQQISERLTRIIELEQLAGVFGLMMIAAYYRPSGSEVGWQLPGTAWLFMTVGVGTTMGIVVSATLSRINRDPQFTAALLGLVAFTAGIASFLRLSPVTVCFLAGALAANVARTSSVQVRRVLERLERPIYFLFMVIAGALWHPWEWEGWVLMAVFVSGRFLAKWCATVLLARAVVPDVTADERKALYAAPMGALSIAIVVSAQDLYSGPTLSWLVTAVIAGALVTELALQAARRRACRPPGPSDPLACDTRGIVPEVD